MNSRRDILDSDRRSLRDDSISFTKTQTSNNRNRSVLRSDRDVRRRRSQRQRDDEHFNGTTRRSPLGNISNVSASHSHNNSTGSGGSHTHDLSIRNKENIDPRFRNTTRRPSVSSSFDSDSDSSFAVPLSASSRRSKKHAARKRTGGSRSSRSQSGNKKASLRNTESHHDMPIKNSRTRHSKYNKLTAFTPQSNDFLNSMFSERIHNSSTLTRPSRKCSFLHDNASPKDLSRPLHVDPLEILAGM